MMSYENGSLTPVILESILHIVQVGSNDTMVNAAYSLVPNPVLLVLEPAVFMLSAVVLNVCTRVDGIQAPL